MTGRVVLPLEAWPEADWALWQALTMPADGPLDDAGALSHLRPATLDLLRGGYGRWLAWLQVNAPETMAEPPALRGSPERLWAWIQSLEHAAPMSRSLWLDGALRVLTAGAPGEDWAVQWRLRDQLRRAGFRDYGSRKHGRIISSSVLLQAGLDLAGPRADAAPTALQELRNRRDGLMVAFLALLPIRLRSFCALELGRSVLEDGSSTVIALSGEDTKNGHHWEAPLQVQLAEPFARYLAEVRPLLMARRGTSHYTLWVSDRGQPYVAHYLSIRIRDLTEALTGVRVSPHFFRDAAATTLAHTSPAAARLIRPLLGHASYGTAERHYIQAQGIETGRDYAALLARLKQEA